MNQADPSYDFSDLTLLNVMPHHKALTSPPKWTTFHTVRVLISLFDILTDTMQAASLLTHGHGLFGALTIIFPALGITSSIVAVIDERRRNQPQSSTFRQLVLRVLQVLTLLHEGLVESGPELVVQQLAILHGVHTNDLAAMTDPEQLFTWKGINGLVYLNEQTPAKGVIKFVLAVTANVASITFRIALATILFATHWIVAFVVLIVVYVVNVVGYCLGGQILRASFLSGYASLFSPFGCSTRHLLGHAMLEEVTDEVERAKIVLRREIRLANRSHALFAGTSLLLLVAYAVAMETIGLQSSVNSQLERAVSPQNMSAYLYGVPLVLCSLSGVTSAVSTI